MGLYLSSVILLGESNNECMYLYIYVKMVFKIHADNISAIPHFEKITLTEE